MNNRVLSSTDASMRRNQFRMPPPSSLAGRERVDAGLSRTIEERWINGVLNHRAVAGFSGAEYAVETGQYRSEGSLLKWDVPAKFCPHSLGKQCG